MTKKVNKEYILKIGCFVSLFLLAIVAIIACSFNKQGVTSVLTGKRLFSDFAETISYCIAKNPYNGESGIRSIYPPFAYLPFYPFALICKKPLEQMLDGNIPLEIMYQNKQFVFSFILFYIINISLILFFVAKLSKLKGKNLVYLLIITACFGPFIYAFGRANVIITACLFALMFFYFYNSDVKWKREVANLCLACSVAIKIYPALIAIFFLKDKRYKDLLKTVLYSLILLFVPFLLIDEGLGNIKHIWDNFTVFNTGQGRVDDTTNISLDSLCYKLFGSVPSVYSILSPLTRHGLVVTSICVLLLNKSSNKFMQASILSICVYELWQGVSYGYTMSFIIVPLVLYIINFEELSKVDKWYYGVCFALIAAPIFYVFGAFTLQSITLVCLVVKALVDLIKDILKSKKENVVQEKA